MHALIAFFIGPIGRWFGLAAVVLGAIVLIVHLIEQRAEQGVVSRINHDNTAAGRLADEAERPVQNCPAGHWDREKSRCNR